jgi:hypothetical protein
MVMPATAAKARARAYFMVLSFWKNGLGTRVLETAICRSVAPSATGGLYGSISGA